MINNMDRKTYKERLYCLKLWKLEEKRNRHDLIEVVKMRKGLSRLKLNELYTLNDKVREPEGNSWKLVKFWCTQDCCKYFFYCRVFNRCSQLDQRTVYSSGINALRRCLITVRGKKTRCSAIAERPRCRVHYSFRQK